MREPLEGAGEGWICRSISVCGGNLRIWNFSSCALRRAAGTDDVKYTNTGEAAALEKKCASGLIREGCVIISQHSDTTGPAVACEEVKGEKIVYHVGYNQSMAALPAPTTGSYRLQDQLGTVYFLCRGRQSLRDGTLKMRRMRP